MKRTAKSKCPRESLDTECGTGKFPKYSRSRGHERSVLAVGGSSAVSIQAAPARLMDRSAKSVSNRSSRHPANPVVRTTLSAVGFRSVWAEAILLAAT